MPGTLIAGTLLDGKIIAGRTNRLEANRDQIQYLHRQQIDPMNSRPVLWLAAFASTILSACAIFTSDPSHKPKDKPPPEPPKLVGRIASIPADKRFVLIQSYGSWKVETGTILTARGTGERTANLLVTGESLGQFAAADLQSGLVEVGDAVYSRHVPKPPAIPPVPEPVEHEPLPTDEKFQKNN